MLTLMATVGTARADVFDDIGFTTLLASGATPATGAAIRIDQVEASRTMDPDPPQYLPDPLNAELTTTTLNDASALAGATISGHATNMAIQFAGSVSSMTPDVSVVDVYDANDWLNFVLLVNLALPPEDDTGYLANHSWIGAYELTESNVDALERVDWLVEEHDFIQVVGTDEGSNPILGHAMNVISVGFTAATRAWGTVELTGVYTAGRGQPHLVAPRYNRSLATATVTSAVAMLLDSTPSDRLPPEVVKALLMAGAARETANTGPQRAIDEGLGIDIVGYGDRPSGNGLDLTYGAGQLDINASYRILQAGNQPSLEDGGTDIDTRGYHYDAGFGGANGTNSLARYRFSTGDAPERLATTLAWHADVESGPVLFNPTLTLHPLDLELVDVTGGAAQQLAISASAIDNTETLYLTLEPERDYELRVLRGAGGAFEWDYALAWNRVEVPDAAMVPALPAGGLLIAAAALGAAVRRAKRA